MPGTGYSQRPAASAARRRDGDAALAAAVRRPGVRSSRPTSAPGICTGPSPPAHICAERLGSPRDMARVSTAQVLKGRVWPRAEPDSGPPLLRDKRASHGSRLRRGIRAHLGSHRRRDCSSLCTDRLALAPSRYLHWNCMGSPLPTSAPGLHGLRFVLSCTRNRLGRAASGLGPNGHTPCP